MLGNDDVDIVLTDGATFEQELVSFVRMARDPLFSIAYPLRGDPHRAEDRRTYWRAIAMRRRSSGSMKWSWSSVPRSICTQAILPVNRLPAGV